jgi:hypothetical protein
MSAPLCECGHPESEHVSIVGCMADSATKEGGGVAFECECAEWTPAGNETETTESYPLSRGD